MEKLLEVKDLEKSYKDKKAVNKLNFDVYKGEIVGLLGPNGAGKSTTINMLSTVLKNDGGSIKFNGGNLKRNLGIVPQSLAIYEEMSAYRNVEFFTSLYGIKGQKLKESVIKALDFVGLRERADDKPKTFSGGMKRRLNIACAIAHNPKLIILDEPTVGIDPQSRNHILSSIKKLRDQEGTTVIYTTHYMEEVQEICDRIIIMDEGEKIAEGTIDELLDSYKNTRIYKIFFSSDEVYSEHDFEYLYNIEGIQNVSVEKDRIDITTIKEIENLDKIIMSLIKNKLKISHMTSEEGNLETVFLKLTGRKLRD